MDASHHASPADARSRKRPDYACDADSNVIRLLRRPPLQPLFQFAVAGSCAYHEAAIKGSAAPPAGPSRP